MMYQIEPCETAVIQLLLTYNNGNSVYSYEPSGSSEGLGVLRMLSVLESLEVQLLILW